MRLAPADTATTDRAEAGEVLSRGAGRCGGRNPALRFGGSHHPVDRARVAALYAELARRTGSPSVELNRAVVLAETEGLACALALVVGLALDLADTEPNGSGDAATSCDAHPARGNPHPDADYGLPTWGTISDVPGAVGEP